ncbi:MAG: V-type ATP synthase subunit I [Phocaeicola sp.]
MITKMKKLSFLVYHKEYETFLNEVRELGVVHIVEKQRAEMDDALLELKQKNNLYKDQLDEMFAYAGEQGNDKIDKSLSADELQRTYMSLQTKLQTLTQKLPLLEKELESYEVWGDFDWNMVKGLKALGWKMRFYTCKHSAFNPEWIEKYNAIQIDEQMGRLYFITLSKEEVEIDAEPIRLPNKSLSELQTKKQLLNDDIAKATETLKEFSISYYATWKEYYRELLEATDLEKVRKNSEPMAEASVIFLEGWIPAENETAVRNYLTKSGAYYEIRNASKEDDAPIKLKNNAYTRMYEVITKMYGMPEYGEFDPTPLLAPFFTLFFAFCVGDAGYGLLLILLGFILKKKMAASMAGMMNLVITLGGATTVLGAVFGTFFGINLIEANIPWLEEAKQFMVSSDKQMYLALAIGVVHILFAMAVKAFCATARYGFLNSLSEWGWFICVVGFIATGGLMHLEHITPELAEWSFIGIGSISAIGIFLFNNIKRNVFVNIGAGLWDTYNMATGLVGDVLSYIRLYALGLASCMLGVVFNQLAFMINIEIAALPILGTILTIICCGLILIFGHTLNIGMACLSAFVHPLRLTFVEYFKNSGYQGKGKSYKPFSTIK